MLRTQAKKKKCMKTNKKPACQRKKPHIALNTALVRCGSLVNNKQTNLNRSKTKHAGLRLSRLCPLLLLLAPFLLCRCCL